MGLTLPAGAIFRFFRIRRSRKIASTRKKDLTLPRHKRYCVVRPGKGLIAVTSSVAIPQAGDLGAVQHRWGDLGDIELREQARRASEKLDLEELWQLTLWHLTTSGRKGDGVSPNTLTNYRRAVADLVHWCKQNKRSPHSLKARDAGLYRSWLQREGGSVAGTKAKPDGEPYSKPLSPASVNLRLAGARRLLGALIATEARRTPDPFARVAVADPTPAHSKREGYSDAEYSAMVAACRGPRELALILLGGEAGLRASELTGLTWEQCDLSGRILEVIGKGNKKRHVPISSRCRDALQELYQEDGRPPKSVPVFCLCRQRVHALVTRIAQTAQVPKRGVHSLRHRAGTRWYALLKDLVEVARIMGHSDPSTARIYVHRGARDDLLELADQLAA